MTNWKNLSIIIAIIIALLVAGFVVYPRLSNSNVPPTPTTSATNQPQQTTSVNPTTPAVPDVTQPLAIAVPVVASATQNPGITSTEASMKAMSVDEVRTNLLLHKMAVGEIILVEGVFAGGSWSNNPPEATMYLEPYTPEMPSNLFRFAKISEIGKVKNLQPGQKVVVRGELSNIDLSSFTCINSQIVNVK